MVLSKRFNDSGNVQTNAIGARFSIVRFNSYCKAIIANFDVHHRLIGINFLMHFSHH